MPDDVIDPIYLPYTEKQVLKHFCKKASATGDPDRHVEYFRASMERAKAYAGQLAAGTAVTSSDRSWGRQVEKDERFWGAATLMSLFHDEDGRDRAANFAKLLERAKLPALPDFDSWEDALAGDLTLWF